MKIFLLVLAAILLSASTLHAQPTEPLSSLGVGMWLWEYRHCGTPQEVASQASSAGLGHVYLKVHDGKRPYASEELVEKYARALKKMSVKIFVWGFNHANDPQAEAGIIKDWLDKDYVDGYVYNTEQPLKSRPKWGATEKMVVDVWEYRAANHPQKWLGFAPYAIPSLHSALPYAVLVQYTDFIEPQMYWAEMNRSVKTVVNWTYREWLAWQKENDISKPIIPLGQTYGDVKSGEVLEFGRRTRGYFAVSFWSWQHATDQNWQEVRQIAEGRSGAQWQDVADVNQPLPSNVRVPFFAVSWWNAWWRLYWPVAGLLLVAIIACQTLGDSRYLSKPGAAVFTCTAFLWPYLLAASCIVLLIVALGYGSSRVYYFWKEKKKRW